MYVATKWRKENEDKLYNTPQIAIIANTTNYAKIMLKVLPKSSHPQSSARKPDSIMFQKKKKKTRTEANLPNSNYPQSLSEYKKGIQIFLTQSFSFHQSIFEG